MATATTSGTARVTLQGDRQILITREFNAPKHLVYRAVTEPELVKRWWNAKRGEVTRTLGRHTNDKAVSFYIETPGLWEIEYGWSGQQVDDEVWIVRQLAGPTSLWGHELVGGRELMSTAKS